MPNDRSRTRQTWRDMHRRCNDPRRRNYARYGGRGIAVCERWNDFDLFYQDMGPRPPGYTIERIDNATGYDPFNCIWTTKSANSKHTDRNDAAAQRRAEAPEQWEIDARRAIRYPPKPPKEPFIPAGPVHGSRNMYAKHGCRCEICVDNFRARLRNRYKNKSPEWHKKKAAWLKNYRQRKRNGQ